VDQFRFRPRVARLEDRENPAVSPEQIFADLASVQADTQFISMLNEHPEYLTIGVYQPFVAGMLTFVTQRQRAASANLTEFYFALQSNVAANPALATTLAPSIQQVGQAVFQANTTATVAQLDLQYLYDALGIKPVPPVPPSPPTPNLTDDSGMSNTVPDITNSEFQTLPDGLKIRDVQVGTGEAVQAGGSVDVYYTGYLTDGTVFDSVRSPASPANFSLNGVIPGFAEGLIGMQPGGIRQIVIPPELGYGAAGQGTIPPNSTLIFEVKLISTTPPGG
jgi:FKBP-type peptidyl-prolyl cis-trans isomerase FkpA